MRKKVLTFVLCIVVVTSVLLGTFRSRLNVDAKDLMEGIVPNKVSGKEKDDVFISSNLNSLKN